MISLVVEDVDFDVLHKNLWEKSSNPAGECLTGMDLHYTLFPSMITLEVGGIVIIGPRRRVPLFDFLVCIAQSIARLRMNEPASISFTEAADRVFLFPLNDEEIEILTSHQGVLVRTDRAGVVSAFEDFLSSGRAMLLANVSGLELNPNVHQLIV